MGIFKKKKKGDKIPDKKQKVQDKKQRAFSDDKLSADNKLISRMDQDSFEVEQFKKLRTKIMFPASGIPNRSVAVTSTILKEGKSFVAANLALSIARNLDKRRVILVDCDIRVPAIHRIFGYGDDVPGLADYLSAQHSLTSLFLKTDEAEKLSILPGGSSSRNSSELLTSSKMLGLLEKAHTVYKDHYFIFDLPSPKIVAESSVIARRVDGVIIVVQYGRTPQDQVKETIDLVGKEKILGVVLNRFDTSMHSLAYRIFKKYIQRK